MVAPAQYVPDRGDIVWFDFDPQAGHEQAGRRPALVLTLALYNSKTRLALICPITNQAKGYTFEVALPAGLPVTGTVLADHIKSQDWRVRRADFICKLPNTQLADVLAKVQALLR